MNYTEASMQADDEARLDALRSEDTKAGKFQRMLDIRLPKAIKAIELLGNLSSRDYEYTDEQRDALFQQLDDAVDGIAKRFGLGEKEPSAAPSATPVQSPDTGPGPVAGTGPVTGAEREEIRALAMELKTLQSKLIKVILGWPVGT